jgi:hypothetical protein
LVDSGIQLSEIEKMVGAKAKTGEYRIKNIECNERIRMVERLTLKSHAFVANVDNYS